jgi:5'-phosphate synthase pdxT subunit
VPLTIGVLALQGDVREHLATLRRLGVEAITVRRTSELEACDGLVIPGGESTTMANLARSFGLMDPLRERVKEGLPAFGTCAGMIMLADRIVDGAVGQETVGGLDITVRRNAFGRQVDSFEGDLAVRGVVGAVHGVFIRAPWVEEVGEGVEVLAEAHDHPVAVRQGRLLATSFHPEVGEDARLHALFVDLTREGS